MSRVIRPSAVSPFFLLALLSFSCKHNTVDNSSLSVTGGREDANILETSVGISPNIALLPDNKPTCTGTFITDRLLMTAAHCVIQFKKEQESIGATGVRIYSDAAAFKGKIINSSQYSLHPEYEKANPNLDASGDKLEAIAYLDVGFVIFPAGTAPANMIAKLSEQAPKVGDKVQLVGWGQNFKFAGFEDGKRNYGRNSIQKIDAGRQDYILIKGVLQSDGNNPEDLESAVAGVGDSGGPLYNDKDEVIGVTSFRSFNEFTADQIKADPSLKNFGTAGYANISNPLTRQYIDAVKQAVAASSGTAPRTDSAPRTDAPRTDAPRPSAPRADANNAVSGDLPPCVKPQFKSASYTLTYENAGDGKGYMKRTAGDGYSCHVGSNEGTFPNCVQACPDLTQTSAAWGWCTMSPGYACKN